MTREQLMYQQAASRRLQERYDDCLAPWGARADAKPLAQDIDDYHRDLAVVPNHGGRTNASSESASWCKPATAVVAPASGIASTTRPVHRAVRRCQCHAGDVPRSRP